MTADHDGGPDLTVSPASATHRARTVVLGASHWHMPLCADRIAQRHDVVAVSDPTSQFVEPLVTMWQAPLYASWEEVLVAHADIELAYVFLPHDEMREACLALVARGVPFVVEKPAGLSLQDLAEIRSAAATAGVPVAVPLVQQGGPIERWLTQAGTAVYESTQFVAGPPGRYLVNGSPWMVQPERAGGGCLVNLAPHFVDLFLRSAGGTDVRVTAALSTALHGGDVEDYASMTITSGDGRVATVVVGYAFPGSPLKRHCSFMRIGEAGAASVGSDGQATFTAADGTTTTALLVVDSDPLYAVFVDRVADRLAQGFAGVPGLDDLHDAMRVIWDAYAHARGGEPGANAQHR